MKNNSSKHLYSLVVCALAGAVAAGCGGDTKTNNNGGGGSGINGGVSGTGGTVGGSGTGGSIGTGNSGTGGTSSGGTGGTVAGGTGGDSGGCVGSEADCNVCRDKANGVYAMKVELDVYWRDEVNTTGGGGELADPGRGKINIYFRGLITDVNDQGMGSGIMHPCGTELPPFVASASCAAIQIQFPDSLWDNAAVPDYKTTGHTTGFGVGDILTVDKTTGLLGLSLNAGDMFPDYTKTPTVSCAAGMGKLWTDGQAPTTADAPCFPDQDGDGNPGITVNFKDDKSKIAGPGYGCPDANSQGMDYTFNGAPLSLGSIIPGPTTEAHAGWIGLQTELGGSGKIKDGCASGVGVAEAGAGLPSRVLHCIHITDSSNCTQADSAFLDKNAPNYHILKAGETPPAEWKFAGALNGVRDSKLDRSASLGPRSSVIRLGDLPAGADADAINTAVKADPKYACGMIRSTQFLPFE
jgi:hypothetical protein